MKLGILASHPVQYQTPLFRKLAEEVDLMVYFRGRGIAEKEEFDPEFGLKIKWDIPLLEGYKFIFLRNFWDFVTRIYKDELDACLFYGWNSYWQLLGIIFAKLLGIKVLIQGESPLNQEILKTGVKQRLKLIYLKILFSMVNSFLYIGQENRKFYEYVGVSNHKLFFTPYAVDNERFIKEAEFISKEEVKNLLGLGKNIPVILFSGKLISKKRPMDLLKAFELLKTKAKLVYVGDGQEKALLEKYASSKNLDVVFAGFQNQSEISKFYKSADIFVLPSGIGETWGLVVNEAMCFGLPVIVSDIVGCGSDLVKDGENGFVFRKGNITELKEFICDLMINMDKRLSFGEKSSEIVRDYNYDKDLEGILSTMIK